jgi:Tfp pilus assembly protein PilV
MTIMKLKEFSMNRGIKDESGMTLIESLIAILVLLVGLLGMAEVLAFSVIASKTHGRDSGKATVAARDKMEELTGLDFSDTTTNVAVNPPFPANGVGLTAGGSIYPADPVASYSDYLDLAGRRTTAASPGYTRQWQIINESANVKRIIVSVTSDKSFRYGTAPSTIVVTEKTP